MVSPLARWWTAVASARRRSGLFDHGVRTLAHYSRVDGSGLAGSVTYFAFLSFFPILAIAFFLIGYVSRVYPEARDELTEAVGTLLPHMLGQGEGQIRLSTVQSAAGTAGLIGAVALLYTGLGWLSGMRAALEVVFEMPRSRHTSVALGRLRDLALLAVIGLTLMLTVALTGVVTGSSTWLLDVLGLGHNLAWLVRVVGALAGVAANTLLFSTLFRLLARPLAPPRALWEGALLGALGFEVLKLGSTVLLASTRGRPAFQAFGIALILLIWINYFSRVVMYAAAWAHTAPAARAARAARDGASPPLPSGVPVEPSAVVPRRPLTSGVDPRLAFGAGAATALGLLAMLRRHRS
jgi:membrane protein